MIKIEAFFSIFPDYPNLTLTSKIHDLDLQRECSCLTAEQRKEMLVEYCDLGLIEHFRNDEYRLTYNGLRLWQQYSAKDTKKIYNAKIYGTENKFSC